MDDKTIDTLDSLADLEKSVHSSIKTSLVHIAGYLSRKDEMSEHSLMECTTFYYEKYGSFTKDIDRGGLNVPSDKCVQWVIFSYIIFNLARDHVCRKLLSNILYQISYLYSFSMSRNNSKVFFKCKSSTPRSSKEPAQKVLKLSQKH